MERFISDVKPPFSTNVNLTEIKLDETKAELKDVTERLQYSEGKIRCRKDEKKSVDSYIEYIVLSEERSKLFNFKTDFYSENDLSEAKIKQGELICEIEVTQHKIEEYQLKIKFLQEDLELLTKILEFDFSPMGSRGFYT
jgi:hypothetical protein